MRNLLSYTAALSLLAAPMMADATKPVTRGSVGISRTTPGGSTDVHTQTSMPNGRLLVTTHTVNTYSKGAAHPTWYVRTINHDMQTGKDLKLGQLFKPGYLKALSASAVKQLEKAMPDTDGQWIRSGAGPKAANFSAFEITQKGVKVNFSDYQVGPHGAGAEPVLVPWSALKDFIKPGTAISHYAK